MKILLIILSCLVALGLYRVIRRPRDTFIQNLRDVFFIDILIELYFDILDFFDID